MINVKALKARGQTEAEIRIDGEIGDNWFGDGLTSKKFAEDLTKLGDVRKITVRINSPGGSVYDGVSIYNQLRSHGARIEVLVEGLAASIASVIAMAGDTISMATGSMMMIHSPWTIAFGNAADMRETAAMLEKHESALVDIYVKRSGANRDEVKQMLLDETWFNADEAVDHGFADTADAESETAATEQANHREVFKAFAEEFRRNTAALTPLQIAAALKSAVADAFTQETDMSRAAPASVQTTDTPPNPAAPAASPAPAAAPAPAVAAAAQPSTEQLQAARQQVAAEETARRVAVRTAFGRYAESHAALLSTCLEDMNCSVDVARERLLAKLGERHEPLGPGATLPAATPGQDESEKRRDAAVAAILARVGSTVYDPEGRGDKLPQIDNSNPFRGFGLFDLAEDAVRRMGVTTRGMNRSMIVAAAFGHTTSDFPNLLENVMHKLLIAAYQGAEVTWPRVARVGDLIDFRAHPRYRFGTFSDLKVVNEAGRYEQGTIADAEKESITGKRKGRVLVISREMVVNDDLQGLSDAARGMGRAATRTIDKDVYALPALNGGNGPQMSDGNALFHANHGNIAATPATPTVVSIDAARVQMGKQKDPSANDYIGLRPAVAWCPLALGSTFRTVNDAQYDPDANNKLQRPNSVRNVVRDIVDSPRLDEISATAWYLLAAPTEEPVFEVAFLGGVREPRVEQEQEFSSDSLQWKVVHEYGVAAIGWRGIVKNAGA